MDEASSMSPSPRLTEPPVYMIVARIPTALWLTSSRCDVLALITRTNPLVRLAHGAQALGVLGTLALHGLRPAPTPGGGLSPAARELARRHDWLNNTLPVLYALSVGLRSGSELERQRPAMAPRLLSLLGAAGLFASRALAIRRAAMTGAVLATVKSPGGDQILV
jgi:hypothetical protein